MNPILKIMLAVFFFAFLASFVGSLVGVAVVAFTFGYSQKNILHPLKNNKKHLNIFLFILMELGFLASSLLHLEAVPQLKSIFYPLIALFLGGFLFFLGERNKKTEKSS